MVSIYVAITDRNWFDYLRRLPECQDVNFWQPGGKVNFRALEPGELFLFKLHSPENFIVGGGVFAHASLMPVSLAWETFGEQNGARSLAEMRERIRTYRKDVRGASDDYVIGCRVINSPFFLERANWVPVPASFSRHVQQGKLYDAAKEDGRWIWDQISKHAGSPRGPGFREVQERYGEPSLFEPRLGQAGFRIAVIDAYDRRCAVTDERILPVLEAAHIKPYSHGGEHSLTNGLLLRTDLHRLFDRGYVTVTDRMRFEVSRRIKEDFNNGRYYYEMHGNAVRAPQNSLLRPSTDAIEWHNSNVYLG